MRNLRGDVSRDDRSRPIIAREGRCGNTRKTKFLLPFWMVYSNPGPRPEMDSGKPSARPWGSAVNGPRPRPIISHSPNSWIAANDPLSYPWRPVPRVAHQGAVGV
jgi:hypothetical protein